MDEEEDQAAVENFSTSLDDVEEKIKRLQSIPWAQICGPDTPPLDSARLHLMVAYAVNALFWMYLRTRGEKVINHPVKAELERVKRALRKVKEAEAKQAAADAEAAANGLPNPPRPTIDTSAARRFVKAALAGGDLEKLAAEHAKATATSAAEAEEEEEPERENIAKDWREAVASSNEGARIYQEQEAAKDAKGLANALKELEKANKKLEAAAAAGDESEDVVNSRKLVAKLSELAQRYKADEDARASLLPEEVAIAEECENEPVEDKLEGQPFSMGAAPGGEGEAESRRRGKKKEGVKAASKSPSSGGKKKKGK